MGGIGKTTLAKRVYEDPLIVSHFPIRAWVIASRRQYTMRKVLVDILGCIVSLTSEISKKDDEELAEQVRKSLMGQRYLIVIDDIWSVGAWDEFSRCLPYNNTYGSRVLMTSLKTDVIHHVASSGNYIYYARTLNLNEGWNLFIKIASNGKCFLPPESEIIGRRIVEKCMGLPLLIVLMGGLLATLNNSPIQQWQDIESELNSSTMEIEGFPFVFEVVEVCYKYLPHHLKPCFLYLGLFNEDADIYMKNLIKLWVAEGFLNPEMDKSLEAVAMDYLHDLINRRLVQVKKRSLDGKIKSCMLHGLLHEFCITKAQEEDIATIIDEYHTFQKGRRWISCQSSGSPITLPSYSSPKARSIFYFCENIYLAKCRLTFSSLKLLRLFKLQRLQTLILSSWTKECQLQLPRDVLNLPWLRHVRVDKGSSLYLPDLVQDNFQTLLWLKVTSWDTRTTDFTKLPNLKELGIYIEGEVLADDLQSLVQLHQLDKLKFEMGRVERFNLPTSFPPNLKQLSLRNTYLSWEEMDVIAKLPNLNLLKLKDFAFCGSEWKSIDGGFQQLKLFLIERSDLEHWDVDSHHFLVLERLILRYCWDFEKLPDDFDEIYTLRLIELDNCCSSLVASANEIQLRQRDLGYEALVVRDVTKVELPSNGSSERSEFAI